MIHTTSELQYPPIQPFIWFMKSIFKHRATTILVEFPTLDCATTTLAKNSPLDCATTILAKISPLD